jgi:hypothetical protein
MIAVESIFADGEHAAVDKSFTDKATQGSSCNSGRFTLSLVITSVMFNLRIFVYLRNATKIQPGTTVPLYLVLVLP